MHRLLPILLVSNLMVMPAISLAFDNNKKGFMLGLGGGVHTIDNDAERDTHSGLASTFRIGVGINDTIQLYYLNNVSWYNRDGDTAMLALSGLGASLYLTNNSPAFYLTSAIGVSSYNELDDSIFNTSEQSEGDGLGIMFGAGLEVIPHLNIEAVYMQTEIDPDRSSVSEFDASTFQILVSFVFY